jgi:glyoxylase-like metal-dependent hydrolase (beta-lactamase superfamily II)
MVNPGTPPLQLPQIKFLRRQAEDHLEELKSMRVTLPTITFDRSLIMYQKSRVVEILWLGRAHTDGDVFVYLPKEKVIVTGDALQGWMPYMGDGYTYDWIKTLESFSVGAQEEASDVVVLAGVPHEGVNSGKQVFQRGVRTRGVA